MSDDSPDTSQEHNTAPESASTFVLTREEFDQIPGYRAKYILLYAILCIWWVGPKILAGMTGFSLSEIVYFAIYFAILGTFLYWFTQTLRTMQYAWPVIIPTLLVVSLPIPGLLAMAYMDRKIADQWDKADDAHTKYRERIYPDEENQNDDSDPE